MEICDIDFTGFVERQREWSQKTFGPGKRTAGIVAHIRKELSEIEAKPNDLDEWIDVVILAINGASRQGFTAREIAAAIISKQTRNELRDWPDWRNLSEDEPIEHVR